MSAISMWDVFDCLRCTLLITLIDLLKMILFFIEFYAVVLKIISVSGFCIGRCLAKYGQLRGFGADFVKNNVL